MIRSMTGYGEASAQAERINFSVELRSLNNRYFKASLRLPEPIAGLEAEFETLMRKRLVRGSIVLNVRMAAAESAITTTVNDAALLNYLEHLKTIHDRIGSDQHVNIDLTALLALPGVVQPAEDDASLLRKSRPIVTDLLNAAIDSMLKMRSTEGEMIAADLLDQARTVRTNLEAVKSRAPQVIEEYHERLRLRIDELAKRAKLDVDRPELIREVAIFADRADISEECTRLAGHLEHFENIIADDDGKPAGRTLDFIAQELLREANTIASKSNDAQISRSIVDVKSAIDRIKEQVQNVE